MPERILIVGYGSIGRRHLRVARDLLTNADIRVLRRDQGAQIPTESNGIFTSLGEAVEFAPEVAVIANPSSLHLESAQVLAEAGVHLLVEKPLSNSSEGVERLLNTCRQQNLVLQVGYNLRFLPSLLHFREMIMQGAVGKVLSVRCEVGQYLSSWRPDTDYREGVSAKRELGGGVLLELSHELDYLRWIFGEIEWVSATLAHHSNLEIDVEDSAYLTFGFTQLTNNSAELVGSLSMDFIRQDSVRSCTAIGESGSLRWNGLAGLIELYEKETKGWKSIASEPENIDDTYLAQWSSFLSCVENATAPLITGEDGEHVLRIIEAARISNSNGGRFSPATLEEVREMN